MVDSAARRSPDATSPVGAVSAVPFVASAPEVSGAVEMSEVTDWFCGSSVLSLLPPAVKRSVSVTDFLSDPPLVKPTRGSGAFS